MAREYDLIVLGVGGMGSAAMFAGAERGWRVLGIEQFGVAHDRGSSHGQTRIIRAAYYEHPNYVPLALEALAQWGRIEQLAGERLFFATGLLQIGLPDSEIIAGVRESAQRHNLAILEMAPSEIESRWPYFQVGAECVGLFEPGAGYLRVEKCVAYMTKLALARGAEMATNSRVVAWEQGNDGMLQLRTEEGARYRTRRLVITAGPWSPTLLEGGAFGLQVVRKQQQWFQIDRHEIHQANGGCCFLVDTTAGCFYGFPQIDQLGMKVAEHSGGQPTVAPEELHRGLDADDLARAQNFVQTWFRFSKIRLVHYSVCMYTMSPDQHFIVDRWPGCENVAFAAGLSGHGFKFAPVIGRQLVDLVDGGGQPDCQFLSLQRFQRKTDDGT